MPPYGLFARIVALVGCCVLPRRCLGLPPASGSVSAITVPLERRHFRLDAEPLWEAAATVPAQDVAETELHLPQETPMDMAIMATISVGSPPQTLRVLLDSGSSDLWLPSSSCKSCRARQIPGNQFFNARKSNSAQFFGTSSGHASPIVLNEIHYGSGHVRGVVVHEHIGFAGLQITGQGFLLVEEELMRPPQHLWDGILGLGFPRERSSGAPLFTKVSETGVQPVFTFVPSSQDGGAKLLIGDGAYQDAIITSTLAWAHTVSERYWSIQARVGVSQQFERRMVVDTGTTLVLMPRADFLTVVRDISRAARCTVHRRAAKAFCACADVPYVPALQIHLDQVEFSLGSDDLFESSQPSFLDGEPMCKLQISIGPMEADEWILGDIFLRKVVTIFDFSQRRVGFAKPSSASEGGVPETYSGIPSEIVNAPPRGFRLENDVGRGTFVRKVVDLAQRRASDAARLVPKSSMITFTSFAVSTLAAGVIISASSFGLVRACRHSAFWMAGDSEEGNLLDPEGNVFE